MAHNGPKRSQIPPQSRGISKCRRQAGTGAKLKPRVLIRAEPKNIDRQKRKSLDAEIGKKHGTRTNTKDKTPGIGQPS